MSCSCLALASTLATFSSEWNSSSFAVSTNAHNAFTINNNNIRRFIALKKREEISYNKSEEAKNKGRTTKLKK